MHAFNLRGTNGSGKTHVALSLLAKSNAEPHKMVQKASGGEKPLVYKGKLFNLPIYFLGSYETYCGGCDTIPKVSIVAHLLSDLLHNPREKGLVFYEGLMISHMIGTVGNAAYHYNERHLMGFLDTPLETCIERVKKRRLERGNTKPFDPDRTLVGDYKAVKAARKNAMAAGFKVVDIPHKSAIVSVEVHLKLLADVQ